MSVTIDVSAVAGRIKHHLDESKLETIWGNTKEQIILELLDAGVVTKSHPHRRISFAKAYTAVWKAIHQICDKRNERGEGYVFLEEPGIAMLGYRSEFWPSEPWTLATDTDPELPENLFRHCPTRQFTMAIAS